MYLTFYHQTQGLTFVSITPRIEPGTQLSIKKYLLKELTQIDELFLLLLPHHLTSFLPLLPIIVLNIQSTRQLTAAIPQIYARKKNDSIYVNGGTRYLHKDSIHPHSRQVQNCQLQENIQCNINFSFIPTADMGHQGTNHFLYRKESNEECEAKIWYGPLKVHA